MFFAHPPSRSNCLSPDAGVYLKGKEISFCQSTGLRDVDGESVSMVALRYCVGERGASLVACIASVA